MNNILVPLGTSPDSKETLQYAVDFAADFGAKVFIMDVYQIVGTAGSLGNVEKKVLASNTERIKGIVAEMETKGVDIKIASYNGDIIDGLKDISKKLQIDLMIIAPKSNDSDEKMYLGNTTGRMVKQTDIPTLIVPKGTVHQPIKSILTAFKSGILKRSKILFPLIEIKNKYASEVNLLLVKTPGYTEDDLKINTALLDVSRNLIISENATTYHGVLEHFQSKNPDMLCVFRRKRGFFKKLWEKSTILKSEFHATIPVLVLSVKKD
ncbi:UspA domain-containing protein [Croceitalea dokdonensis DOKDO 023]|uniref:UspA domain-containing protein n=1 Tax=Croceitalea dokdonensis DOKDO 023 TaxID=1300341 RepID=A0A0P7AF83_9FLAO|nr:universal stress protein [Croceitalea dokdonensis]KPM30808.1 UspA domain-containing protein [Croceitalea dokdonensis DOKDO 023]